MAGRNEWKRFLAVVSGTVLLPATASALEPPGGVGPEFGTNVPPAPGVKTERLVPVPDDGSAPATHPVSAPPGDQGKSSGWRWWPFGRRGRDAEQASDGHDPLIEFGAPYHYQGVFNPPPLGASVKAHMRTQVANGEAAMMVLYQFDFLPGSDMLNPAGAAKLQRIAALLPRTPFPVIVEPVLGDPLLSESRQQQVIALLETGPFPVPPQRILLAAPPANGMDGPSAELTYRNLEILTGSGGRLRTRFDIFESARPSGTGSTTPAGTPGAPR